jgi:hypothetical protein
MDNLLDEIMEQELQASIDSSNDVMEKEAERPYDNYIGFTAYTNMLQGRQINVLFNSLLFIKRFATYCLEKPETEKINFEKPIDVQKFGKIGSDEIRLWILFDISILTPLEAVRFIRLLFDCYSHEVFNRGIYINGLKFHRPDESIIYYALHYYRKPKFGYDDYISAGIWKLYDNEARYCGYDSFAIKEALENLLPGEYDTDPLYYCIGERWMTVPRNNIKQDIKYIRYDIDSLRKLKLDKENAHRPNFIMSMFDLSSDDFKELQINRMLILKRNIEPYSVPSFDDSRPAIMVADEPERLVIILDVSHPGWKEPVRRFILSECKLDNISLVRVLGDIIMISDDEIREIVDSVRYNMHRREYEELEHYNHIGIRRWY